MDKSKLLDDLAAEGHCLYALLKDRGDAFYGQATSFKNWSVHDVMAHLHYSDHLALLAATDAPAFKAELAGVMAGLQQGRSLMDHTREWLSKTLGAAQILEPWRATFDRMVDVFRKAPADARYDWFGPPMGVAMFATARQMETWAHGLSIFDVAGVARQETDRIENICVIGCKTYSWTFQNRGQTPPGPMPMVNLTLPSGKSFKTGEGQGHIKGSAVDFAKVVTQTRNIEDVALSVAGDIAEKWMAIAQCFAGPPENPPAPGTRL